MQPELFQALFPFELDPFQTRALRGLADRRNVIVSAPTGSGKTVVGELAVYYALALNLRWCGFLVPRSYALALILIWILFLRSVAAFSMIMLFRGDSVCLRPSTICLGPGCTSGYLRPSSTGLE